MTLRDERKVEIPDEIHASAWGRNSLDSITQIKSFCAEFMRAFRNIRLNSQSVKIWGSSYGLQRTTGGQTRRTAMNLNLITVSLMGLLLVPGIAFSETISDADDIKTVGMENLKPESKAIVKDSNYKRLHQFDAMPKIQRGLSGKVIFRDVDGKSVKERKTAQKEFKVPSSQIRQKKSAGGAMVEVKEKIVNVKSEEPYLMSAGQGVFVAHWEDPQDANSLNEDTPIKYTEAIDSKGGVVAKINGDYRLEAAPNFAYFVGLLCFGGIAHASGTVAFFDNAGQLIKEAKVFDFGGTSHVGITEDGKNVLMSIRGFGKNAKSGMALFNSKGELLWKKEEKEWDLAGPLDALRSYENGERTGYLTVSAQGHFFVLSKKGVSCYSLTGNEVWTNYHRGTVLAINSSSSEIAIWEPKSRGIIVIDGKTGNDILQIESPCAGGPYYGDDALQFVDDSILLKVGDDTPDRELSRCFAVLDTTGKVRWKKVINRKRLVRPFDDNREDVYLGMGKTLIIKENGQFSSYSINKP